MPKLPPNYVKAPAAKANKQVGSGSAAPTASGGATMASAPKEVPSRRSTLRSVEPLSSEAVLREVLVQLDAAQYSALQAACEEQRLQGEVVSIEEMLQRVVAGWMTHTAQIRAPQPNPIESGVLNHLIRFAESPVERWRALGSSLRRLSNAALRVVYG